jgi:biopolymer transport protein ExbD
LSIRFRCPECGKKIETDVRLAGRRAPCPRCKATVTIPLESVPEEVLATLAPTAYAPASTPAAEEPEFEATEIDEAPVTAAVAAPAIAATMPAASARPAPRKPEPDVPLTTPLRKIDFEDLIDMTAMVDIVFFLLIFFLVTSMHALDSTIPMPPPDPREGAASAPSSLSTFETDDDYVVVQIDRNDVVRVEGAEVKGARELLFKLRDLRNGPKAPSKMLVVGHGDATHGTTVMVLDAGHDVEMESVRLALQDENE